MHPDAQRRLESGLNDHDYSCDKFCSDLPYTFWNTCPLCLCGLMPVFVVCFSALFHLDYATHVTDIGAEIINEMGLSYTVYYTAGCWPTERSQLASPGGTGPGDWQPQSSGISVPRCNSEQFEIAAGEFDAITGGLLRYRNVTRLHARRIEAVKVTPDWRFITFVASLANDLGNLYVVDARERNAEQAIMILNQGQMNELDESCQKSAVEALEAAVITAPTGNVQLGQFARRPPQARLAGFKHLQVIIPGIHGGYLDEDSIPPSQPGASPSYRAAFAFECVEPNPAPGGLPLQFSKLAVVDFQLWGLNATSVTGRSGAYAQAELRVVDVEPATPPGASGTVERAVNRLRSQSCPRFVPSRSGEELLFVAEDISPGTKVSEPEVSSWNPSPAVPSRLLALATLDHTAHTVRQLAAREEHSVGGGPSHGEATEKTTTSATRTTTSLTTTSTTVRQATLLKIGGEGSLPAAPVRGCPEFVPSLYLKTESLTDTFSKNILKQPHQPAAAQAQLDDANRDNFVEIIHPQDIQVLGIEGQVLAASLHEGIDSTAVGRVHLLYNVDKAPAQKDSQDPGARLRLGGCQPIRAAGRRGHMKLQWVLETLMNTFQLHSDKNGFATWLACMTADQQIAIVESPNTEQWINMSMPWPLWMPNTQDIWCPEDREEACFEVWSNPNPNE